MNTILPRYQYREKVLPWIGTALVKVFTGMRRSGKSYILRDIYTMLVTDKNISPNHIVVIDKEQREFDTLRNATDLSTYIQSKNIPHTPQVLMIDEIQDITDWERVIRSLIATEKWDIYITGSNSHMLSGELATYLTGRYIEIPVAPLTFREFREFYSHYHTDTLDSMALFQEFIRFGGLPGLHRLEWSAETLVTYLEGVWTSILYHDLIKRYQVRHASVFADIFRFLIDNIGNTLSSRRILAFLREEKIILAADTLRDYLLYFANVFLLRKVQREDIR